MALPIEKAIAVDAGDRVPKLIALFGARIFIGTFGRKKPFVAGAHKARVGLKNIRLLVQGSWASMAIAYALCVLHIVARNAITEVSKEAVLAFAAAVCLFLKRFTVRSQALIVLAEAVAVADFAVLFRAFGAPIASNTQEFVVGLSRRKRRGFKEELFAL